MSILIGADIVPTKSNLEQFAKGDIGFLVGEHIISLFQEADYRILNLEVPLADRATPIDKGGHNMIAPTSSAAAIKALDVDLLTLCNNHILDQGAEGLSSTIDCLD